MAVSQELDILEDKMLWHWRDSMRVVRFFGFDARLGLLVPVMLLYPRLSTLILTIVAVIVFYMLERYGLTFPAAFRSLRVWIIGSDRDAWPTGRRRKFVDYGA